MSFAKMIFGAMCASSLATAPALAQTASAIGGGAQGSVSSVNGVTQGPDGRPYYAGRSASIDAMEPSPMEGPSTFSAQGSRARALQDDDD